jgi:hypothetical protein
VEIDAGSSADGRLLVAEFMDAVSPALGDDELAVHFS